MLPDHTKSYMFFSSVEGGLDSKNLCWLTVSLLPLPATQHPHPLFKHNHNINNHFIIVIISIISITTTNNNNSSNSSNNSSNNSTAEAAGASFIVFFIVITNNNT
jgi:hypothetical protein